MDKELINFKDLSFKELKKLLKSNFNTIKKHYGGIEVTISNSFSIYFDAKYKEPEGCYVDHNSIRFPFLEIKCTNVKELKEFIKWVG